MTKKNLFYIGENLTYTTSKSVDEVLDIVEDNTDEKDFFSGCTRPFCGDVYNDGFEIEQVPKYRKDYFLYKISADVKDIYDGFDETKRTRIDIEMHIDYFTIVLSVILLSIFMIIGISNFTEVIITGDYYQLPIGVYCSIMCIVFIVSFILGMRKKNTELKKKFKEMFS